MDNILLPASINTKQLFTENYEVVLILYKSKTLADHTDTV